MDAPRSEPILRFTPAFLLLTGGLIIWGLRFLAGYSFTAIACAKGWAALAVGGIGIVPIVLVALTLVALAGCGAIFVAAFAGSRAQNTDNRRFLGDVTALVAALSALAIVWETLPAFLVPTCEG